MKDKWRETKYGAKLLSIRLASKFDPSVILRINPMPDCPLCVLGDDVPSSLESLHSSRFSGTSYRILLEDYSVMLAAVGVELTLDLLVRHFNEHFIMRNR